MIDEKLVYENSKGQSIQFGNEKPFILVNVAGTGNAEVDVQTQKAPFQDGATYIDSLLMQRDISLTVLVLAENQEELFMRRAELQSVLNPKIGPGALIYDYGIDKKLIEAVPSVLPAFVPGEENRTSVSQVAQIEITCPDPFWRVDYAIEEPMAAFVGMFEFPLGIPESEGIEMGTEGEIRVLLNNGDVTAPVEIEFKGPCTNPRIDNHTTGEFIKVNQELGENDVLYINTAFGNKRVEIKDEDGIATNAFGWIDLASTFWQLQPGENEIEYTADTGQENATLMVSWRERYLGV